MRALRSVAAVAGAAAVILTASGCDTLNSIAEAGPQSQISEDSIVDTPTPVTTPAAQGGVADALTTLGQLTVKGRAPKTGYSRSQFGRAWTDHNTAPLGGDSLSTRENILSRDLKNVVCKAKRSAPVLPPCIVQSGVLHDPYTGTSLNFVRGEKTSPLVPIDHVVPLISDRRLLGAKI